MRNKITILAFLLALVSFNATHAQERTSRGTVISSDPKLTYLFSPYWVLLHKKFPWDQEIPPNNQVVECAVYGCFLYRTLVRPQFKKPTKKLFIQSEYLIFRAIDCLLKIQKF